MPLTIQVPLDWLDKPEILELVKKGHTIIQEPLGVDLFLGPKAHYFLEEMFAEGYLELAVKRINKEKKGVKSGKGEVA